MNDVSHAENLSALADDYFHRDDLTKCEEVLVELSTIQPNDFYNWYRLAYVRLCSFKPNEAKPAILQALRLNPESSDVLFLLGECHYFCNEFPEAGNVFRRAVQTVQSGTPLDNSILIIKVLGELSQPAIASPILESAVRFLMLSKNDLECKEFIERVHFHSASPEAYVKSLFLGIVHPFMQQLLRQGRFSLAYHFMIVSIMSLALKPATEENWAWCMSRINPLFAEAGLKLRRFAVSLPPPLIDSSKLRLAIVIDKSISGGSGGAVIARLLHNFSSPTSRPIEPVVYAFCDLDQGIVSVCKKFDITIHEFSDEREDLGSRLLAARTQTSRNHVAAALYTSTYEGFVVAASSLGLASVQLYMTMGWFTIEAPGIDQYLYTEVGTRSKVRIKERDWLTIPSWAFSDLSVNLSDELELRAKAAAIREARFKIGNVIVGSMARTEKINQEHVLAIATILTSNPEAVFLWFGLDANSPEVRSIASQFERLGIANRCFYEGWVDTKVYSRLIDIHLDCLDMPSGLTMFETFFSGRAYVLRRGPHENAGLIRHLHWLLDDDVGQNAALGRHFVDPESGENLLMVANDTDEYIALASRLIKNPELRSRVGNAAKQYSEDFLLDEQASPNRLAQIIREISEEKETSHIAIEPRQGDHVPTS